MIGSLRKLKDSLGNYIFPVTSSKAVYMSDGTTTLESQLVTVKSDLADMGTQLATHKTDLTAHGDVINTYRSGKDANSIFTIIEYKRLDGTLAKKSTLSGGTSPKYTTRTVMYYDTNGTTVLTTKVYTLTYTVDDLTSEVTT